VGREPPVWFPFRKEWGDVGGKAPFILTLTHRFGDRQFCREPRVGCEPLVWFPFIKE